MNAVSKSPKEPTISAKLQKKAGRGSQKKLPFKDIEAVMGDAMKIVDLLLEKNSQVADSVSKTVSALATSEGTSKDKTNSVIVEAAQPSMTSPSALRSTKGSRSRARVNAPPALSDAPAKNVSSLDATPSTPHVAQPSSTTPKSSSIQQLNAFALGKLPALPKSVIPAGSEVSEVVVEGQDEGSSNESSTSGEDDEQSDADVGIPIITARPEDLANVSLEALLRGPVHEGSILAQISSSNTSEDEDEQESDQELEDEDERLDADYRRLSRKFSKEDSSDEEPVGDAEEEVVPPIFMDVDQSIGVDEPVSLISIADRLHSNRL